MQGYIDPAIFYKDNEFLKAYFVQVQKYGFEYNEPSEYEVVRAKTPNESTVMLIDAVVTKKDLKK